MRNQTRDEGDKTDLILAALADPVRRSILRDLDTTVGITVTYLREEIPMTRQGIQKHLKVMVDAGFVIKSCRGRTALYYFDPRPIRKVFAELGRLYKRDLRPLGNLYAFGSPYSPFD